MISYIEQWDGAVVGTALSRQEGCRFDSHPETFLFEVYMFFVCVLGLPPSSLILKTLLWVQL